MTSFTKFHAWWTSYFPEQFFVNNPLDNNGFWNFPLRPCRMNRREGGAGLEYNWRTKKNSRSAFPASSRQGMFVMIIKWSSMSFESNHILVHYFLFPKEYVFSFVKFTNRYNLELTHLLFHLQQNSKTKYTASKRQCIFGSVQLCEIFFICMTKKSRNKNEQGSFNCFTRDLHSAL